MRIAFVVAIFSFAVSASAALLLPADHPGCKPPSGRENTCDDGMEFYRAGDGRCGCLEKGDFFSTDHCMRAFIACDEDRSETFTSLFQYRNQCGMLIKTAVGCGCFATYDDLPRE